MTIIRHAVDHFISMEESEVDGILTTIGSSMTPGGWEQRSVEFRRLVLLTKLKSASDQAISDIADYFYPKFEQIQEAQSETTQKTLAKRVIAVSPNADVAGPIFVVHGHAHAVLHEAVRVLERTTDRDVIILHEQPNAGKTILEKFEAYAAAAAYAVILLTGDDEGRPESTSESLRPRGRQNVIFELGFFFGKLGRKNVAVLLGQDVEKPSDVDGLVYISIDMTGAWKTRLAHELDSAGIDVNYARIP